MSYKMCICISFLSGEGPTSLRSKLGSCNKPRRGFLGFRGLSKSGYKYLN